MSSLVRLVSLIHGWICRFKSFLYARELVKTEVCPLPVISVGNISFGGSEKTPLVMHLLAMFQAKGLKPAVVTRGYKSRWEKKGGVLSDGRRMFGGWEEGGDEPAMMAQNFPSAGIFIGRHRSASCRKAKDMGFDIIILDDGFQHLRLKRDLDIVLHDPAEKSRLRESVSSLKRADILLLRGPRREELLQRYSREVATSRIFFYEVRAGELFSVSEGISGTPSDLHSSRLLSFSGIARPKRFLDLLAGVGLIPVFHMSFPDHHTYPRRTRARIEKKIRNLNPDALITTEKDAVKVSEWDQIRSIPLYVLKIRLAIEPGFEAVVLQDLDQRQR